MRMIQNVPDLTFAKFLLKDEPDENADRSAKLASKLMKLAQRCRVSVVTFPPPHLELNFMCTQDHQLSGRALRKLPVLAYATHSVAFTQGVTPGWGGSRTGTPVETWIDAMGKIIDEKRLERENMGL